MLPAQFPGDYYSDDLAKSLDFRGYFDNKRQQQEAFKNQELNRQSFLQDYMQKERTNPLDIQRKEADLASVFESTRTRKRANDVQEAIPISTEIEAELKKLQGQISKEDLDMADRQLELALRNPDPNIRKQAEAMLPLTRKMREIQAAGEERRKLEELKQAGAKALANFRATLTNNSRRIMAEKQPSNVNAYIAQLRQKALMEADPEKKLMYQQEAQSMADWLSDTQVRAAAARQAGNPDAAAMAGIPAKPMPPAPKIGAKSAPGSSPDNPIILK